MDTTTSGSGVSDDTQPTTTEAEAGTAENTAGSNPVGATKEREPEKPTTEAEAKERTKCWGSITITKTKKKKKESKKESGKANTKHKGEAKRSYIYPCVCGCPANFADIFYFFEFNLNEPRKGIITSTKPTKWDNRPACLLVVVARWVLRLFYIVPIILRRQSLYPKGEYYNEYYVIIAFPKTRWLRWCVSRARATPPNLVKGRKTKAPPQASRQREPHETRK